MFSQVPYEGRDGGKDSGRVEVYDAHVLVYQLPIVPLRRHENEVDRMLLLHQRIGNGYHHPLRAPAIQRRHVEGNPGTCPGRPTGLLGLTIHGARVQLMNNVQAPHPFLHTTPG